MELSLDLSYSQGWTLRLIDLIYRFNWLIAWLNDWFIALPLLIVHELRQASPAVVISNYENYLLVEPKPDMIPRAYRRINWFSWNIIRNYKFKSTINVMSPFCVDLLHRGRCKNLRGLKQSYVFIQTPLFQPIFQIETKVFSGSSSHDRDLVPTTPPLC